MYLPKRCDVCGSEKINRIPGREITFMCTHCSNVMLVLSSVEEQTVTKREVLSMGTPNKDFQVDFPLLPEEICEICSHPKKSHLKSISSHRMIENSLISHLRAMSPYYVSGRDLFSKTLRKAKSNSQSAEIIAKAVLKIAQKMWPEISTYDMIVSIPKTQGTTSHTVSEILGNLLAEYLNIEVNHDVLICTSSIKLHSKYRTLKERKEVVYSKFSIKKDVELSRKSIILVDDLVTSGSTISICANLLGRSGARKIMAIVAGRTIL